MRRVLFASLALVAASCAAPETAPSATPATPTTPAAPETIERSDVLSLNEAFQSSMGDLRVINVQDDFQVVRCTDSGAIAGCFDAIFTVPFSQVRFNRWIPVPAAPGLEVALVTPTKCAFQIRHRAGDSPR